MPRCAGSRLWRGSRLVLVAAEMLVTLLMPSQPPASAVWSFAGCPAIVVWRPGAARYQAGLGSWSSVQVAMTPSAGAPHDWSKQVLGRAHPGDAR